MQRITPNISIHSDRHPLGVQERYNPLRDYLLSLEKTRTLGLTLGQSPQTAYAIAQQTFPNRHDPFDPWLMLGETLAHLELLEARQQIERVRDNGHVLFRCVVPLPVSASGA